MPPRYLPPPRQCPWSSWSEWLEACAAVERIVYARSPDAESLCRALSYLHRWLLHGHLSLPIELTMELLGQLDFRLETTTAIMLTSSATRSSNILESLSTSKETLLRLSLSASLSRFVSRLADSGQTRGGGLSQASVMLSTARLGLPRELVDIRHEGNHAALPSLPWLERCASQALVWTWQRYWQHQRNNLYSQYGNIVATFAHHHRLPATVTLGADASTSSRTLKTAASRGGGGAESVISALFNGIVTATDSTIARLLLATGKKASTVGDAAAVGGGGETSKLHTLLLPSSLVHALSCSSFYDLSLLLNLALTFEDPPLDEALKQGLPSSSSSAAASANTATAENSNNGGRSKKRLKRSLPVEKTTEGVSGTPPPSPISPLLPSLLQSSATAAAHSSAILASRLILKLSETLIQDATNPLRLFTTTAASPPAQGHEGSAKHFSRYAKSSSQPAANVPSTPYLLEWLSQNLLQPWLQGFWGGDASAVISTADAAFKSACISTTSLLVLLTNITAPLGMALCKFLPSLLTRFAATELRSVLHAAMTSGDATATTTIATANAAVQEKVYMLLSLCALGSDDAVQKWISTDSPLYWSRFLKKKESDNAVISSGSMGDKSTLPLLLPLAYRCTRVIHDRSALVFRELLSGVDLPSSLTRLDDMSQENLDLSVLLPLRVLLSSCCSALNSVLPTKNEPDALRFAHKVLHRLVSPALPSSSSCARLEYEPTDQVDRAISSATPAIQSPLSLEAMEKLLLGQQSSSATSSTTIAGISSRKKLKPVWKIGDIAS